MFGERFKLIVNHSGTLFRFGVVGGTSYILTIIAFSMLYDFLNVGHGLSATVAYFTGASFHFTMNRRFTFRSRQDKLLRQLAKYVLLTAVNYLMTFTLFEVLLRSMHTVHLVPFALSVAVTTATGYLVMCFWVFPLKLNGGKNPMLAIREPVEVDLT